ncbi:MULTISPECIES: hypothetical protein [Methylorubrum]|uniref:Uncharacterized protein n=1 Tax=Methylorubrum extorquens (strain ATCC 14718 / DSM 1338 / JCM 2805 / NCIMB 9133 / AM1) TaxID=272630 RepID=C5B3G1_METEA|nr:hypothetical protein [Methylorubrum extorquens]ACS42993.1 Hypothetical protein MexAM1_META2p0056 [Methylorubrum extorquens AM1]MCP1545968.1 hypothetical protein [Methylorubrum extorquens]MCP1591918.1 hypothetical protein [Methylorubrum extorquens]OAH29576.1 hypothetical protein AX289_22965 [Methylorubrum populi]
MSFTTTAIEPAAAHPVRDLVPNLATGGMGIIRMGPAGRTVAAVYATCALLALAYPQALASWLDDFEPNPVVDVAQAGVARLVAVSEALGVAQISESLRDLGKSITRKPQ